jgi:hypothetical protein
VIQMEILKKLGQLYKNTYSSFSLINIEQLDMTER